MSHLQCLPRFILWVKKARIGTISYGANYASSASLGVGRGGHGSSAFQRCIDDNVKFSQGSEPQQKWGQGPGQELACPWPHGWLVSEPTHPWCPDSLSYNRLSQVGGFCMGNCQNLESLIYLHQGKWYDSKSLATLRPQITRKKFQTKNSW